jgi:Tol biopolymer transport system component
MRAGARVVVPLLPSLALGLVLTGSAPAGAQTPFIPYYGKNEIRYDRFKWHIYTTDHFEIYYYPEIERHLERVAAYAESAYQHVSSELKHDLAVRVPLVIFKTQSEFQQQNVIPGAVSEGTAAFAEPQRDRMLLPLDFPPDKLYGLIVHELTHIFEFDIIPRTLVRRGHPLWVDEGLSDYMRGTWDPLDLMLVRDVAVADIVPKMSKFEDYGGFSNPRITYSLGHAVFEFIENKWGKEGIRQFLFSLRKSVIGGGENAFQEALNVSADEFDDQFAKYLKDRFKPFRDKERPVDYGRDLSPDPEETHYTGALSVEPSPSGDLLAAVVGNRKDQELDIVLLSTRDRQVVRNVTRGFDKDSGYEYIAYPTGRFNTVPWIAWGPKGDLLAYFARTEEQRSLILRNVVTGQIEKRFYLREVDAAESPAFSPNGRTVALAGMQNAIGDIFLVDVETGAVTNVTNDSFADYAPIFAPDGKSLMYISRISGNDKLFRLDLATKKRTQLTFGTHDDAAARFLDDHTVVFSSTALDPSKPVEPEVARNGNIYNIWTLDLTTNELRQYTDTLNGNLSVVPLRSEDAKAAERRVTFVSYFKGQYGLHQLTLKDPKLDVASSDFGAPGPVIDFQAPLSHSVVPANKRQKGTFEKLFLEGRPPVNVGVTSSGDLFGGTQVTFTDVLGDQQFNFFAASISQYRTLSFSYLNLARRFQWAGQAYQQSVFYYGLQPGVLFDPGLSVIYDRDDAIATRTSTGGSLFGIYPFNRYNRVEFFGGIFYYEEQYDSEELQQQANAYQEAVYGRPLLTNGTIVPFGVRFINETTIFREFGPLAGTTMALSFEVSPNIGDTLQRQTMEGDARYYKRVGTTGVLAFRLRGFKSWGDYPDFFFFGGNSELRGYEYLEFVGDAGFHGNAELRFPLIEAMLTPLGVLGGIRGTVFAGFGGASFDGRGSTTDFGPPLQVDEAGLPVAGTQKFKLFEDKTEYFQRLLGFVPDQFGYPVPVYGPTQTVSGFRLKDGRASYGVGLETFLLGFPAHFDWSWRTLFNKEWEDVLFALEGGSEAFRDVRFDFWIGYDF